MGEIIKSLPVRSYPGEKEKRLRIYFDSGSPYTFIKESKAKEFKAVLRLPRPRMFTGLGNGRFQAAEVMHFELKLLNFWCSHYCYVINDSILEADEDVLIGHDFMQKFDMKLDLKKRDIILNKYALKRAQKVRLVKGSCRPWSAEKDLKR